MTTRAKPEPAERDTPERDDVPRLSLRPREAARALGIGQRKLWELTNRNEIPHLRLDKTILYPVDELRRWLAERAGAKGKR